MSYKNRDLIASTFTGKLPAPGFDLNEPASIVTFAFGNRVNADGDITPGPINYKIAELAAELSKACKLPIYAQTDIADVVTNDFGTDVAMAVGRAEDEQYLSTAGAMQRIRPHLPTNENGVAEVLMVGHAFHVGRMALVGTKLSINPHICSQNRTLTDFDSESGQIWTRNVHYWRAFNAVTLAIPPESKAYSFLANRLPKNYV